FKVLQINLPTSRFSEQIRSEVHIAELCNRFKQGIGRPWTKDFIAAFSQKLETIEVRNAGAWRQKNSFRRQCDAGLLVVLRNRLARDRLTKRIGLIDSRCRQRLVKRVS